MKRRLLTISHSYCVTLNRRLAQELARLGEGEWDVTAVAPRRFPGDLKPIELEVGAHEPCAVEGVDVRWASRIHLMLYRQEVREILRRGWDMVHCWEEPYILCGAQIGHWTPRESALVYCTFQNIAKDYPPPFSWAERYCLQRCTGWIAGGHTIEAVQLARTPVYSQRPYEILPLGVDTDFFHVDPAARRSILEKLEWSASGPPVIGYLGRFVEEKGLRLLMDVLERVRAPWRALFVGGGPWEGRLREFAAKRPSQVRVVAAVEHKLVPAYINAFDLLCAPSQTTPRWREQFGRMLIEAFACGVPVLTSDSGEIPHVAANAGWVVGEKDQAGWEQALELLLTDEARRREMSEAGLARVQELYAWPQVARRHLEFFNRLL